MAVTKIEQTRSMLQKLMDDGQILANGRLPPERALCEQLAVSRSTLRSVLYLLEAEGKLWRRVGSGTYTGKKPANIRNGFIAIAEETSPSELIGLRLILEPQVARLAALNASQSEIAQMNHCVQKAKDAVNSESYEIWDSAFHNCIASATHNNLISEAFKSMSEIRKIPSWSRLRDRILTDGAQSVWSAQHEDLVNAIENRDGALAEALAKQHVLDLRAKL